MQSNKNIDNICIEPIKSLWTSSYTLTEQFSQKKRIGLLIKVLFAGGKIGYNSIHPLSQFKEGILSEYTTLLKSKRIIPDNTQTALLHTILQDAYMDATARSKNQSLLFGHPPIKNHYLISNINLWTNLDELPFDVFKIKMGFQLNRETIKLRHIIKNNKKTFQLRLDFNEKLSKQQWKKWEAENKDLLPFIDFIEDPFLNFSYTPSVFPLAGDWCKPHYSPIRVFKASRFKLQFIQKQLSAGKCQRVIFTHSLIHPLEARLSWVKASQFYKIHPKKREICGLNYPLNLYKKNDFSCFHHNFYAPLGTGLGFDSLLEKQKWKKLK